MSALPKFTIKELMDAGVHFGHKTMRWNPKMQQFIFGSRNNIHIIDLQKTAPMLRRALTVANQVASKNGRILFVATKNQASSVVAEAAERCGQYYVNHRWMGGMLTNWETVSKSIKKLNTIEKQLEDPELNLVKKERLHLSRQGEKLELALGGIRRMGGKPDLIIIIDTNRENIALLEARKLNIPTIAIVDTNCDPENIDYIVPGNDDSIKSIRLFCELFSDAILSGLQQTVGGYKQENEPANDSEVEKIDAESKPKAETSKTVEDAATNGDEKGKPNIESSVESSSGAKPQADADKQEEKISKEAKKDSAKKAPAKKDSADESSTKKAPAKKDSAKKAPAKKDSAKKAPAKKSTAKASTAKKDTAKKDAPKEAAEKKATGKQADSENSAK